MTINNTNIVTYIFTNRLTSEDERYTLEGNTNKGRDAVNASLLWLYSRFKKNGQTSLYETWKTYLYAMSSSNLSTLEAVQAYFYGLDTTLYMTYTMLFEALIKYAIYELYAINDAEGRGQDKKEQAQEIIEGIIGDSAYPNAEGKQAPSCGMVAVISIPTETEIETEAFGMQAGLRRDNTSLYDTE